MAPLKFLCLASASVLFVDLPASASQPTDPENKAVRVDCLAAMNAPRTLAGLSPFEKAATDKEKLPIDPIKKADEEKDYLKSVCAAMRTKSTGTPEPAKLDATYAFALQEGTTGDCQAAVDYWKGAFTNFEGLPPAYKDTQKPYDNPLNVSFVALFNPKDKPKVDCAYFTCPAPAAQAGKEGAQAEKEVRGLVCATTPKALEANKPPFEQGQWEKITAAFTSSASSAVPTFLAFAAVALGVALF